MTTKEARKTILCMQAETFEKLELTRNCTIHEQDPFVLAQLFDEEAELKNQLQALDLALQAMCKVDTNRF